MNFKKGYFLLSTFVFALAGSAQSQTWTAPPEAKPLVAPFKFGADSIKKGETIFLKNCQSCHGLPGKGTWAKITPPPGDPATDKFQKQTDGELFWKITNGKIPMPEFRNILSENERWSVIGYFRSFNPGYVQPAPITKAGVAGKTVQFNLAYDTEKSRIIITVNEVTKDKTVVPLKGADIVLFVKRYFGNMTIGDPKTTNEQGKAYFDFPKDLPGDKTGGLDLIAMLNDKTGTMGDTRANIRLEIGKPVEQANILDTRAWWSTRDKAPIWLIITYCLAVIIVWGFIIRILYSVLGMRKL
ncbi:MAG: cytochrome c [Bacteroidota bacterium]